MATISTNTSLTVANTSTNDGDLKVMQYKNLTINSAVTLTTNNPCRGLLILVQGNCVINGTISVRPSNAAPSNSLTYPIIQSSGSSVAAGGNFTGTGSTAPGIISTYVNARVSGKSGTMFTNDGTGSRDSTNELGSGGWPGFAAGCCFTQTVGARQFGTAFGGGGGTGGSCGCHGSNPTNGTRTQGGEGGAYGCHGNGGGGGGAGLPLGSGGQQAGNGTLSTRNGALYLIVGGNLTGSGTIDLSGAKGGTAGSGGYAGSGGGGSGGGSCYIAVKGTNSFCSNVSTSTTTHSGGTGTINVSGGAAGDGTSPGSGGGCLGIAGDNGYIHVVSMT